MKRLLPIALIWLAPMHGVVSSLAPAALAAERAELVERGRELFERVWLAADPRSADGDGLGPLFNAESCVACHRQGGIGGAGPNENNVDLVTRVSPASGATKREQRPEANDDKLGRLHPDLANDQRAAGTVVLHRFGVDEAYDFRRFELLGLKVPRNPGEQDHRRLDAALAQRQRRQRPVADYEVAGTTVRRSQRQTPSLFGAGLIDGIPADTLRQLAAEQQMRFSDVSGRVAVGQPERPDPLGDLRGPANAPQAVVGRFGWRGQTGTLRQFVLNACANELGLEVPDRHQALDPLNPQQRPPGLDLDREACEALVAYVASLPPPRQNLPTEPALLRRVTEGSQVFTKIGCAECHPERVGGVDGIYSDLLLHDMGSELADPVAAAPVGGGFAGFPGFVPPPGLPPLPPGLPPFPLAGDVALDKNRPAVAAPASMQQLIAFYAGLVSNNPSLQQEWRTPPLWGVRDSAPYLHDGRAATLDDAIRQHGGEAARAVRAYQTLSAGERQKLLAFLESLGGAP